jgi:hypothetical protein
LSGEKFAVFSPHGTLDGTSGTGLIFNFVQETIEKENQLAVFKLISHNFDEAFDGTVVRIPLRTHDQAMMSEISKLVPTSKDIEDVFSEFQNEVAEALLFLKNIEKVRFYYDDYCLGMAEIINVDEARKFRTSLNRAVARDAAYTSSFQLDIHHQYRHNDHVIDSTARYLLQHEIATIKSLPFDAEFKRWAEKTRYFPWVALAAPINSTRPTKQSRIFVTLPLPIYMTSPVNIHGNFALSRDRRSLWGPSDGHNMQEITWNQYLFTTLIPQAWKKMLLQMAKIKGNPIYLFFPDAGGRANTLEENLLETVVKCVLAEEYPIWYASTGQMVRLEDGYLAKEKPTSTLLDALKMLSMPVVRNVPFGIVSIIEHHSDYPELSPVSVRRWLQIKFSSGLEVENDRTANTLLRYVLSDKKFSELENLPLFPCRGPNRKRIALRRRTPGETGTFCDWIYFATDEEFNLFGDNPGNYLDQHRLQDVSSVIEKDLSEISQSVNLTRFGLESFRLYIESSEMRRAKRAAKTFRNIDTQWFIKVWSWLDGFPQDAVEHAVFESYLIPLQEKRRVHRVMLFEIYAYM